MRSKKNARIDGKQGATLARGKKKFYFMYSEDEEMRHERERRDVRQPGSP